MKVKCVSRYDKKGYRMIKFSVQKNDILDALTTTAKAASTKSVISALEPYWKSAYSYRLRSGAGY